MVLIFVILSFSLFPISVQQGDLVSIWPVALEVFCPGARFHTGGYTVLLSKVSIPGILLLQYRYRRM